jgi:hypothetical protein
MFTGLISAWQAPRIEHMFAVLDDLEEAVVKASSSEQWLDPVQMCRIAEQVEFLKVRALGRFDESGDWAAEGFVSAAAWLRARTKMSHGAAVQALTLARRLPQLPETAAAFAAGEISRQHASLIADACTPDRMRHISEVEGQLAEIARRVQPRELRTVVRRLTDALDGDGGAATDEQLYERRRLHLSPILGGMGLLDGSLDAEGTEIVATALDAEMERDLLRADTRSRQQRRADALVNICRRALDAGELGSSRHVLPHFSAVVDIAEFEDRAPDLVAEVRREAAHVGHLSRATLERLSCDCDITRVIIDGPSQIIDVGRATKKIPGPLWKALVVRDRHCMAPGCDRPPGMCQGHHVRHWTRGGETNLDNLVLLCWQHHRARHRDDAIRRE